ncbi:MAG: DivIVA domain-containing protein [bacterium]
MEIITPSDIARVKFSTSFRGYNTQEVDEFLEQIEISYTKLWKENMELKNQVEFLRKELDTYKKMESVINESVIASKKLAEDIKYQAQNEANYIVKKAIMESQQIRILLQKEIALLIQEINKIKEIRKLIIEETRNNLNLLLSRLNSMEENFNTNNDLFFKLLSSENFNEKILSKDLSSLEEFVREDRQKGEIKVINQEVNQE